MSLRDKQDDSDARDDSTLVHAAKQGDSTAFGALVHRYTPMVFRVAMNIMNSREDAEDIVQDAFLNAFQHLQRFEERSRFSTWVTRIAVNGALMKLRSLRRVIPISLDQEMDVGMPWADRVADWKPNPEQLYSQTELREILQQALTSLPHSYRIVFFLRDVEGLSIADTANMLGLTIPNVKARLFRARLKLREHLSRFFERAGHAIAPRLPLKRIVKELQRGARAL
jgi:RNA polymerase sigma-70 factor (ECF subfamily)